MMHSNRFTPLMRLHRLTSFAMVICMSVALSACKEGDSEDSNETKTYTLTIAHEGAGAVISQPAGIDCGTVCSAQFARDTDVVLTAEAETDYEFDSWTGDCSGNGNCTVKMKGKRQINAKFLWRPRQYELAVTVSGNGSVVSDPSGIGCPGTCTKKFVRNTMVTLSATPQSGFAFSGWGGQCSGTGSCVVTMSAARNVSANFVPVVNSYGLSVTLNGAGSVTSNPTGINCGADCAENYASGTAVTLTATPASGNLFSGWSGACSGTGSCVVTMSAARTVTANFAASQFSLNVSKTGSGTVTSSPAGINCGTDCNESYNSGTVVTLSAAAASGYSFAGWGGACSGTSSCVVTMSAARNVSASFSANQFALTVTRTGSGTVTSSPAGINCGTDCSESYNSGTVVTLSTAAASGFTFSGWSGACTGTGSCVVTMSTARNVTATFVATQFGLTVSTNGSGTVTSSPAGINCGSDCSENFNSGTSVTLTATAASGYTFTGWTGDCAGTAACVITISSARNVVANFTAQNTRPTLSVSLIGAGVVSSTPTGINCGSDCSENYDSGSSITLSASANSGYSFGGWSGSGISCAGTGNCVITLNANTTVVATFNATATGNVTRVSVSGFGLVSANDNSISCGSVPDGMANASFKCINRYSGGSVTFTATPFSSNFRFDRWKGACAGNTGNTCTLDMSSAKNFGAVFMPVSNTTNICTAMNLKSDKAVYRLDGSFPTLAIGQSFVDPKFGTTIRRVTDVKSDGRGSHNVLKTVYSTISAWNADESLLILYRTDGGSATHELYNGRTYQFIRKLDTIRPVDLEQVYWDTNDPDVLYYANRTNDTLYRYNVSSNTSTAIRTFTQCGSLELHGGGDPMFNSWDSKKFGFSCAPDGASFSYDLGNDTVGTLLDLNLDYGAPQAAPSGTRFYLNMNDGSTSARTATVRDVNMAELLTLDLASGNEHGAMSMNSNGDDTWNAVAFDPGPNGSGTGTVVQHNMRTGASRVIVGQSTGYPYPPSGTHVGGTAFHRSGLLAVSIKDDLRGDSLLDNELLFIDSDPQTNPGNNVCRVGHHRTVSDNYWAEPHPAMSPSGTRILFSSSWGNTSSSPVVNVFVVELPGYRNP